MLQGQLGSAPVHYTAQQYGQTYHQDNIETEIM